MIIEQEVLDQLQKNYNYKGGAVPVKMETLVLNQVFQVGDSYFVKVSKAGELQPDEHYAAKLDLVRLMGEQGLPVPHLLSTVEGNFFVSFPFSSVGYNMEVHKWIPNTEHYGNYAGQIEQAAKGMAGYHSFLDGVRDSTVDLVMSVRGPFEDMTEMGTCPFLDELREYTGRLKEIPDPLRAHLVRAIPIIRERYEDRTRRAGKLPSEQNLDRGIIHADLHDLQMIFDQNTKQLRAFVDWEGARNDFRSFDLGYTVDRLSTDTTLLYHDLSVPLVELKHDPRKVTAFMKSYLAERTMSEADVQNMVDRLVLECLNRNARWLRAIFQQEITKGNNPVSTPNFEKYNLYFRIMSIERVEELGDHLHHGSYR